MDGTRRRRAQVLGRFFAGLSGLALFAFACFPLLAYAEGSIEGEYKDAPPAVPGKTLTDKEAGEKSPGHGHEPVGTASSVNPPPGSGGAESSGQNGPSQSSGVPGSGKNGTHNQRNPQGGKSGNGTASVRPAHRTGVPASSNGGGSSPLLPIIIAILVLAAISIAAVLIRQRRQQDESRSSVSPKAG
jgi:hypothetical protein